MGSARELWILTSLGLNSALPFGLIKTPLSHLLCRDVMRITWEDSRKYSGPHLANVAFLTLHMSSYRGYPILGLSEN